MLTRRQILRSLAAAALAAVAPMPVMGAAEMVNVQNGRVKLIRAGKVIDADDITIGLDCPTWILKRHEFQMTTTGAEVTCYWTRIGE